MRLRVEDIDAGRTKPRAAEEALVDLRWLGLDWDGPAALQSQNLPAHQAALEVAQVRQPRVYPCTCTRGDVESAASAPHAHQEGPTYPGTCQYRTPADAASLTVPYSWRFRVTHTPAFFDTFRGPVALDLQEYGGDFVVWRSANVPAYQLAVVVDDAQSGVTEVLRGDDLIPSTPRQLLLYEALGLTPPAFAHVPLAVGPDGRRLAKRHGDSRLSYYREQGVAPEQVIGLIAESCGFRPAAAPVTPRELLGSFNLGSIPRAPWVVPAVPFAHE